VAGPAVSSSATDPAPQRSVVSIQQWSHRQAHRYASELEIAGGAFAQALCIACMFFAMTALVSFSSSAGLKITISVPGWCLTGTWPGGV
jgi:hypothetical protein